MIDCYVELELSIEVFKIGPNSVEINVVHGEVLPMPYLDNGKMPGFCTELTLSTSVCPICSGTNSSNGI